MEAMDVMQHIHTDHAARLSRTGATLAAALCALTLVVLGAAPAEAHDLAIGQSKIVEEQVGDDTVVRYELAVDFADLAQAVPELAARVPATAEDDELATALQDSQAAVAAHVTARVRVRQDGSSCPASVDTVDTVRHRGVLFAVLELAYHCQRSETDSYEVAYELFFDAGGSGGAVQGAVAPPHSAHANLVDYRLGGTEGRFVFEPASPQLRVGGHDVPAEVGMPSAAMSATGGALVIALAAAGALALVRRRRGDPEVG